MNLMFAERILFYSYLKSIFQRRLDHQFCVLQTRHLPVCLELNCTRYALMDRHSSKNKNTHCSFHVHILCMDCIQNMFYDAMRFRSLLCALYEAVKRSLLLLLFYKHWINCIHRFTITSWPAVDVHCLLDGQCCLFYQIFGIDL